MASHFSTLGLPIANKDEFISYFKKAYEHGEKIKCHKGIYLKWELGNGIQLWGQLDYANNPIGLYPHYSGEARISIRIESAINRKNHTILDGSFRGWATSNGEKDEYPIVIDTPNMAMYKKLKLQHTEVFQIAAFAHEINIYENDQAFINVQKSGVKFASESFIPSGLFNPSGETIDQPNALAIFNGHIIKTKKIKNPITSNEFIWVLVKTLGGQYDVIIDPSIFKGEIRAGSVLGGSFWLSGLIINKE